MAISNAAEKAFNKIQHSLIIKTQKLGMEENFLNLINGNYNKPTD